MQNAKNLDLLRFLPKSIDDNKDTQERQTKRAGHPRCVPYNHITGLYGCMVRIAALAIGLRCEGTLRAMPNVQHRDDLALLVDRIDDPVDVAFLAKPQLTQRCVLRGYGPSAGILVKAENHHFQFVEPVASLPRILCIDSSVDVPEVSDCAFRQFNEVCH